MKDCEDLSLACELLCHMGVTELTLSESATSSAGNSANLNEDSHPLIASSGPHSLCLCLYRSRLWRRLQLPGRWRRPARRSAPHDSSGKRSSMRRRQLRVRLAAQQAQREAGQTLQRVSWEWIVLPGVLDISMCCWCDRDTVQGTG